MKNYSTSSVVLVRYPFSDLSGSKVRPAVVISASHPSSGGLSATLGERRDCIGTSGRGYESCQSRTGTFTTTLRTCCALPPILRPGMWPSSGKKMANDPGRSVMKSSSPVSFRQSLASS